MIGDSRLSMNCWDHYCMQQPQPALTDTLLRQKIVALYSECLYHACVQSEDDERQALAFTELHTYLLRTAYRWLPERDEEEGDEGTDGRRIRLYPSGYRQCIKGFWQMQKSMAALLAIWAKNDVDRAAMVNSIHPSLSLHHESSLF
jgi:hypothetical protein